MTGPNLPIRQHSKLMLSAFLILLFLLPVAAQEGVASKPSTPSGQEAKPEQKLTKTQAEELFRSVDEILNFVSKDTGLPIKHPVKRQLATRDFVEQFLKKRMEEDKDQQRLERAEATFKKLRLLPQQFELRSFLIALLKEQVAGFYDPKSKTVYLLDWVDADSQKPVLAHELTHALQDQNFDMEKWLGIGKKPKSIQEEIEMEEERGAKQAVLEGQGMIALLDYTMAPQDMRVTDAPQIIEALRAGMTLENPSSPTFNTAPMFLKEVIVFPYSEGLEFELKVLQKRGTEGAFSGVLKTPPVSSRQILQPETYLVGEQIPYMKVADFDPVFGKSWKRWDYGTMGQYDIQLTLKQWLGFEQAYKVSPGWRGGYYFSYWKSNGKKAPADDRIDTKDLGLVYVSRWDTPGRAVDFALTYGRAVGKRYVNAQVTKSIGNDNRIEWATEEGPVVIRVKGTDVVVTEGLDKALSDKVSASAFAAK